MDQNQRSLGFWLTEDFLSCHWQSCFQTAPVSKESTVAYRHYLMHPYFILWRYYQAGSPSFIDEGTSKQVRAAGNPGMLLSYVAQHCTLFIRPAYLNDLLWLSSCGSIFFFFFKSHPEKNVMLFGKFNWQASSFCRTRSPRTSDLTKKKPLCVIVYWQGFFADRKKKLQHWPGAYSINNIFYFKHLFIHL